MGTQLIFCMETNKKADTDWAYIRTAIRNYYDLTNEIKLSPVFMESISKYESRGVKKKVDDLRNKYARNGRSVVIYCIDTDNWDSNPTQVALFNSIRNYCAKNQYDFIWFCRDVEDVFWGHRVHDSEKVAYSRKFQSADQIANIPIDRLRAEKVGSGKSNLSLILDKYMKRTDA